MTKEKINIMIDSCVFFKMIEYNKYLNNHGKGKLDQFIRGRIKKLNKKEVTLTQAFGKEFNDKFKHLSFDEKLDKYKEFINDKVANLEKEIERKQQKSMGNIPDYTEVVGYDSITGKKIEKTHYKKNEHIPQKEKEKAADVAKLLQEQLDGLTRFETIEKDMNAYRLLRDSINDGLIFQGAVEGKYRLYIPFISYDEIRAHTKPKKDDSGWCVWSKEDVESLTRNYTTLVRTKSREILDTISSLAEEYRTKSEGVENDSPMAEDINSVGEYGDSKIAAIAAIAGMILVTNNGKDFVFDKSLGKDNENIRNHIDRVNAGHDYTTDASVYSAEELISGEEFYDLPTKESAFTLTERESKKQAFDTEIEIS